MDGGLSESPLSALVPGIVSGALTGSVPEGHPQHRLIYILTAQEQLLTGSPAAWVLLTESQASV